MSSPRGTAAPIKVASDLELERIAQVLRDGGARTLGPTASTADAVDNLVCAALDVLDKRLTEEQRYIADQIYDLCNSLEATI